MMNQLDRFIINGELLLVSDRQNLEYPIALDYTGNMLVHGIYYPREHSKGLYIDPSFQPPKLFIKVGVNGSVRNLEIGDIEDLVGAEKWVALVNTL